MSILSLSCSNKPVEKEMRMPMLFDTKEQAEKEAINLTVKALIKWEINGCHAICMNMPIKKKRGLSLQF